jgi:hypothetical protein
MFALPFFCSLSEIPMHARTKQSLAAATACTLVFSFITAASAQEKVTTIACPDRGQPAVARADTDGAIHLVYVTADGPRYAKSTDNGKTFSVGIPVVDRQSRKPGLQFDVWDLAVGKGRVHVALGTNAWKLKLPKEEWGYFFATLEPGAKEFTPVRNINRKPSEGFSLAADDNGNVSACWLCDKLFANVSHDNGKTFAPYAEINPTYDPCNCCTTSAAFGADGKLAILYREETNNQRDMFVVLWDQEQNQSIRTRVSTTLWKIDTCPMTYYSIARAPDGYVAAWPTGGSYEIYFARLDQKGNVLSPGEIKTPGRAWHRTGVLALAAPDGSALVAWAKDNQLGWQVYDGKNQPAGRPGSAKTSGNGVAGVVTKDGRFLLVR